MSSLDLCGLCIIILLVGLGMASDVPFVFDKDTSGIASYTSAQLEQAHISSPELAGVPSISTPSDDVTLNFPVVGGGRTPQGTNEKKVSDLRKLFDSRVEPEYPAVHQRALDISGNYPGDYTVDQVSAIFSYIISGDNQKKGWSYVADPRGVNDFFYANETLKRGEKANCVGVGDCGDFGILMSALVESIGGTTRIVLASNNTTGGHAYAEVYLGQLNKPNSQVDAVINWLKQQFETDKIFVNINTSTKEVWLNLDWWPDEKGTPRPGGPFFTGDKNIVLYIRENYSKSKIPLKLPEKTNKQPKLISLISDRPSPQGAGTAINWTAKARDPDNDQMFYKFFLNGDPVTTSWVKNNTWVWTTNDTDVGENKIEVRVRDGKYGHALPNGFDDRKDNGFTVTAPETKQIATTNVTRPSSVAPARVTAPPFAPPLDQGKNSQKEIQTTNISHSEGGSPDALIDKGIVKNNEGNYEEAVGLYDQALGLDPKNYLAWELKGLALRGLGKYDEALSCFDKAISIESNRDEAWKDKGDTLYIMGQYQEAVNCFDKAIQIKPCANYWKQKGEALMGIGKDKEASDAFVMAQRGVSCTN